MQSLRARVTVGLASITAALALVLVVAVTSLTRLGGAITTILRENYRSVIACEDMKEALERQDSAAQFASTGHDDIARPMLVTYRDAYARSFEVEAHNITLPEEGRYVDEIRRQYGEYLRAVDRVLALPVGPARAEAYFRELLPRFTALKDRVQRVARMNQQNMEDADRGAKEMARRGVTITLAVGALALLLALVFAWRLPKTIVRPVQSLARAATRIGTGDLSGEVERAGVAELEPLVDAFTRMVTQLRVYRASSLGELLEAKDLANATIQCLLDPVVVFGRDGRILLTNSAAERTFRLRTGTADELRIAGVVVPEEFARARDAVFADGKPVTPRNFTEAMSWRDDLGEHFFLVRAAPLHGDQDSRAIVVAQDVTRFRRIDDLKTDMVATVSHEFKTPLTSLRMATHLLLEPATGPLSDSQREVVTTARDDTERLRALVDQLLDLVRIEAEAGVLHRRMIDPNRLLDAAIESHRSIARDKHVTLEIASAPARAAREACVDPEKIGIVLANLVSNAIRHTPDGGRVSLESSVDDAALRISVSDTGAGMERDDFSRLVARDSSGARAIRASGRHGLGLTIAQEIVLQHGGELQMESTRGRGSVFTIVLPHAATEHRH